MAVVIRLSRHGSKKRPVYRIVAADENYPRDGRFLEILGTYDPKNSEAKGKINVERLDYWKKNGAKTSQTVSQIIKRSVTA